MKLTLFTAFDLQACVTPCNEFISLAYQPICNL